MSDLTEPVADFQLITKPGEDQRSAYGIPLAVLAESQVPSRSFWMHDFISGPRPFFN